MALRPAAAAAAICGLGLSMAFPGDARQTGAAGAPSYRQVQAELVCPRRGIPNVLGKLRDGRSVRIAYFGGSITAAGNGWREKTLSWFRETFPEAEVSHTNAAIGGTGSDLGVFRMQRDVLDHRPDLIFVEFAVNDGGRDPASVWRSMEGIVRKAWRQDPATDILFVYTIHTAGMVAQYEKGMRPRSTSSMELLADHYGIPSIDLGLRVVELAEQGRLIYKSETAESDEVIVFARDDCHPLEEGHRVYAEVIAEAISGMQAAGEPGAHRVPEPFIAGNQEDARMAPITPAMLTSGWRRLGPADGLARAFRERMREMWEANRPGEKLAFRFRGSEAWLYDVLGPDGGQVVVTVDGKESGPIARFDSYCTYHRLASLRLATELDGDSVHSVEVEIHPGQPDRSSVVDRESHKPGFDPKKYDGNAVRVGAIMLVGEIVE